eukprot:867946-Rhodomonas_salina.2
MAAFTALPVVTCNLGRAQPNLSTNTLKPEKGCGVPRDKYGSVRDSFKGRREPLRYAPFLQRIWGLGKFKLPAGLPLAVTV